MRCSLSAVICTALPAVPLSKSFGALAYIILQMKAHASSVAVAVSCFSGNSKVEASRLDAGIIRRSHYANLSFSIAAGLLKSSFAGLPACSCVFLRELRMIAENETQRRGCLPPAHACYSIASLPHHLERRVADGGCFFTLVTVRRKFEKLASCDQPSRGSFVPGRLVQSQLFSENSLSSLRGGGGGITSTNFSIFLRLEALRLWRDGCEHQFVSIS